MLADNLNLNDDRNVFGYWLAKQINKLRKTISGLSDQTGIDQEYLVQLIKNEVFLREEYVKKMATALHVDEYGLWEAAPKEDHQLTHSEDSLRDLNKYVRDAINEAGFTFKEFCELIGCSKGTMASSLYKGRLPKKFGNQIIDLLNLNLEKSEEPVEIKDDVVVDPVKIEEGETTETTVAEAHPVSDDIDEPESKEEEIRDYDRIVLNKDIRMIG
jgi:transcriptional regulator with XRE-family HTH domain